MEQIKQLDNKQISMPIKEKGEFVYGIKRNISKSILYAGVLPQWKNFMFMFSSLTGIALVIFLSVFLYLRMQELPQDIPLIFQQRDQSYLTVGKDRLPFIPGLLFVFVLLMNYLKGKIYSFDRRLVSVINIGEIICYIFIFVGLSQLFSLILI